MVLLSHHIWKTSTHSKMSLYTFDAILQPATLRDTAILRSHFCQLMESLMLQATKMKLVTVWFHKIS